MKGTTTVAIIVSLVYANFLLIFSVECTEKLVIDTDGGADDAAAILLALSAWSKHYSDFEVVAITCVNGIVGLKDVESNVLKTITIANVPQIKIYARGARKPLVGNSTPDNYFGVDGLGDFNFSEKISAKADQSTYAPLALINLAQKYPQKLNILCLGPLSNIALAVSLDSNFMANVKKFYIMGGSVGDGVNLDPGFEFNFSVDPESNFIVLNHTRKTPSSLFPWETVLNAGISLDWRINELGSIKSRIVEFLNKAESKILKSPDNIWTPADLMATAVMIWPNLIKKRLMTNISPVLGGEIKGMAVVDYGNDFGNPINVEIIHEFQVEEFKKTLIRIFS